MTLILGMLLDAAYGEPRWLWTRVPHPAVQMGRLIGWCDKHLNKGENRRLRGILTMAALCAGAGLLGWLLRAVPGQIIDILVLGILLAQRSLIQHVRAVGDALGPSLGDARRAVAMIVGRDTRDMDQSAVARATIESAAENLSDGVIAPIFWFAIAGLPGLMIYKITNTADSMIGYRTPRHVAFGWAAARFDDLLNLVPARLTAALIWGVTKRPPPAKILQEAPRHRSPNAGWPEAAMAHGLGIALSGPRSYDGETKQYPYVNDAGRHQLTRDDIEQTVATLWRVWTVVVGSGVIIWLLTS